MTTSDASDDLTSGERELLIDAETDDVSFGWVLIHLGVCGNPPATPDWSPGPAELDIAFSSLARLVERGLIRVGRVEYVDGGPPGRVAPVRHIAEPLDVVRVRVEEAVATATTATDWEFACWVVA